MRASHLLRVAGAVTVALDAPRAVAAAASRALCAEPWTGPPGYHVRVTEGRPRRPRRGGRRPGWWARVRSEGERDLVTVPGGTVTLWPGGREAAVRLRPPAGAPQAGAVEVVGVALEHALALHGAAVLHAAAVEVAGVGLLVLGARTAGKSTVTVAALAAGGRVASDDAVVLAGPVPEVRPMRRDLWFRNASRRLLPDSLRAELVEVDLPWERRWVLPRERCGEAAAERLAPAALVELVRDRRLSGFRVQPLAAAEALAALLRAGSPLFLGPRYPGERAALLPALAAAAERLPAYRVRMGRGLLEDPAGTLERLVGRLTDPAR